MKEGIYFAKRKWSNKDEFSIVSVSSDGVCYVAFENAQWEYAIDDFDFGQNPEPIKKPSLDESED